MVANSESIAKASKKINISRKTGERWVKQYNEKALMDYFQIILIVVENLT